jgi:hypothetical protein
VGRRLAYDPAAGRLWVVCRQCERWNLSPLETRWEAIEEAERAFRDTPLRVSTDNIGLARLREGLELVRVGKPPERELLAWRYGDQFGRRRRKYLAYGSMGVLGVTAVVGTMIASSAGMLIGSAGSAAHFSLQGYQWYHGRKQRRTTAAVVDGPDGTPLVLNREHAAATRLVPVGKAWQLEIANVGAAARVTAMGGDPSKLKPLLLEGDVAQRALARLLPYLNRDGGSAKRLDEAFAVLNAMPSVDALLHQGAVNPDAVMARNKRPVDPSPVGTLPPRLRLAMEMVLHTDQERRAMEGELALLEAQWREADAIAKIADSLLLPEQVEARLTALRNLRDTHNG